MSSSGRPWQDLRDRDLANFDTIDHEGIKRVRGDQEGQESIPPFGS
jgi:hypothetical protein